MDFLKSAVASAIAKSSGFPYVLGERVDIDQTIWSLYDGTKRASWTTRHLVFTRLTMA
jgi:SCY1-like protein 1